MASDGERAATGDQDLPTNPQYQPTGQEHHPSGEQGLMKRDAQPKPEDEDKNEVVYYSRTKQTVTTTRGDPGLGGGGAGLDYMGGIGGGTHATGTDYLGGAGGAAGRGI